MGALFTATQVVLSLLFLTLLSVQELLRVHRSEVSLRVFHRLEPLVVSLGLAFVTIMFWRFSELTR